MDKFIRVIQTGEKILPYRATLYRANGWTSDGEHIVEELRSARGCCADEALRNLGDVGEAEVVVAEGK